MAGGRAYALRSGLAWETDGDGDGRTTGNSSSISVPLAKSLSSPPPCVFALLHPTHRVSKPNPSLRQCTQRGISSSRFGSSIHDYRWVGYGTPSSFMPIVTPCQVTVLSPPHGARASKQASKKLERASKTFGLVVPSPHLPLSFLPPSLPLPSCFPAFLSFCLPLFLPSFFLRKKWLGTGCALALLPQPPQ